MEENRLYRCRVCHGMFNAERPNGRLPRACPEHREQAKRQIDRDKKRDNYANGGTATRQPCCVDNGSTQCPQHKDWAQFKRESRPLPMRPADDATVNLLLGLIASGHGYSISR
jgi:hypothetical protein